MTFDWGRRGQRSGPRLFLRGCTVSHSPLDFECHLCGAKVDVRCHTVYYVMECGVEVRKEERVPWFHQVRRLRAEREDFNAEQDD